LRFRGLRPIWFRFKARQGYFAVKGSQARRAQLGLAVGQGQARCAEPAAG
jgi:hypothetical protein